MVCECSDDFLLVWASKPMAMTCQWFGFKTTGMVCQWFDLKITETVFSGLVSKSVATVFSGLTSKPVATVSSGLISKHVAAVSDGLTSKPAVTVFQFRPQNQRLRFGDLSLKIITTVFLVWILKPIGLQFVGYDTKLMEEGRHGIHIEI
jgi:hypothetical protein